MNTTSMHKVLHEPDLHVSLNREDLHPSAFPFHDNRFLSQNSFVSLHHDMTDYQSSPLAHMTATSVDTARSLGVLAPYEDDVDFEALAMQDAEFAEIYQSAGGKVDFQDPKALQ